MWSLVFAEYNGGDRVQHVPGSDAKHEIIRGAIRYQPRERGRLLLHGIRAIDEYTNLTAFDAAGRELTLQADCARLRSGRRLCRN
jgi:hypothetical protein